MPITIPSLNPLKTLEYFRKSAKPEQKVVVDPTQPFPLIYVDTNKPPKLKFSEILEAYYRFFAGNLYLRKPAEGALPARERHFGVVDVATLGFFLLLESFAGWDLRARLLAKPNPEMEGAPRPLNRAEKFFGWVAFIFVKLPLNFLRFVASSVLAIAAALPTLLVAGGIKLGKIIIEKVKQSYKKWRDSRFIPIDQVESESELEPVQRADLEGIENHLPQGIKPEKVVWEVTKKTEWSDQKFKSTYTYQHKLKSEITSIAHYSKVVKSMLCVENDLPEVIQSKLQEAEESPNRQELMRPKGSPFNRYVYFKKAAPQETTEEATQPKEHTYLYLAR